MYEFLSNPPWWVVLILSIALAKLWDRLENGVKSLAGYCMTHATGKLKRFLMGRKIKHLRKIKASRFSQLSIIRLTIKSYAYLTLFILCGLVGLLIAYVLQVMIPQYSKVLGPTVVFTLSATLLFEMLWLHTSSKVSDLIKYNKKIRFSKKISTKTTSQEGASQKEIEAEILLTYYRDYIREELIEDPQGFDYEYIDKIKHNGYFIVQYQNSRPRCHEFKIINADTPGKVCLTLGRGAPYRPPADKSLRARLLGKSSAG